MDFILILVVWCILHIELFLTKTLSIMKRESRLLKMVSKHIGFLRNSEDIPMMADSFVGIVQQTLIYINRSLYILI